MNLDPIGTWCILMPDVKQSTKKRGKEMKRMILWDRSGRYPCKHLVNIGQTMEQYNWSKWKPNQSYMFCFNC